MKLFSGPKPNLTMIEHLLVAQQAPLKYQQYLMKLLFKKKFHSVCDLSLQKHHQVDLQLFFPTASHICVSQLLTGPYELALSPPEGTPSSAHLSILTAFFVISIGDFHFFRDGLRRMQTVKDV